MRRRSEQTGPMRIGEWTQLEEMFALDDAPSVEEFHQRLVLFPPVERNQSEHVRAGMLVPPLPRDRETWRSNHSVLAGD